MEIESCRVSYDSFCFKDIENESIFFVIMIMNSFYSTCGTLLTHNTQ